MTTVWILTAGEDYEGGRTAGVYARKDLAFADFLARAQALDSQRGPDKVTGNADRGVYAHGGCDWIRLTPHTVVERHAITGDPIAEVAALLRPCAL